MTLSRPNQNVAIVLTDSSHKILWVNDMFAVLTGYEFHEVVGRKPSLLQGPETSPEVVRQIRYCLEKEVPFKNQVTNYKKDGTRYQCRLIIHPIHNEDGELTNFIAFEVDATDIRNIDQSRLMNFSEKYRTSSLKGTKGRALYDQLQKLLTDEELYLDSSLALPQLAERLETNSKYLSQVVNQHYGDNLQQFINEFRINSAKTKLVDPEFANLTYFAIGQLCGFKNKSTFYKVFKKFTDSTPHAFVQRNRYVA